jgi:hypothetical protein
MALCTRCGQQTADGVEFCSICGSHSGTDGPGESAAPGPMTGNASYLRPFAAEEPAYPALSDRGPLAPSAARSSAGYSSPSGYLPEYMPPPYGPAAWRDPRDGYLPAPDQTRVPDQAYRLRGPFTPLEARDDVLAGDPGVAGPNESGDAGPGPSSTYPAQDWDEYGYASQSAVQPQPADEFWAEGQPQTLPADQPQTLPADQPQAQPQPLPADPPQIAGHAQALPVYLPPPADLPQGLPVYLPPPAGQAQELPACLPPPAGLPQALPAYLPQQAGQPMTADQRQLLPIDLPRPLYQRAAPLGQSALAGQSALLGPPAPAGLSAPADSTGAPQNGEETPDRSDQAHTATFPAARPGDGSRRPLSGRWISAGVAAGVVIIAAAVAVALVGHSGSNPRAGGSAPGRGPSSSPPSSPATGASARTGALTVTAAAAAGPDAKAVARFVTRYFGAINNHDFATYRTLFSESLRGGLSSSAFTRGYGSSRDSLATLRAITPVGTGELDAAVSFTSHQKPADTPSHSACTTWSISLYLVRQGHGYVVVPPPAGYKASFGTCS